jgi:hypothetical protein
MRRRPMFMACCRSHSEGVGLIVSYLQHDCLTMTLPVTVLRLSQAKVDICLRHVKILEFPSITGNVANGVNN